MRITCLVESTAGDDTALPYDLGGHVSRRALVTRPKRNIERLAACQRLLIRVTRRLHELREACDRYVAGLCAEPPLELREELEQELEELSGLAVSRGVAARCDELRGILLVEAKRMVAR